MYETRIIPVPEPGSLGRFRRPASSSESPLEHWDAAESAPGLEAVATAAERIRNTDVPVGFPTETVYGLGADATRSTAVRGIYSVKGRPSDNPLIVHVCDLAMLRGLLGGASSDGQEPSLPAIYRPLIERFWPGPLTILLPVPVTSASDQQQQQRPRWTLAPEVTAGLPTFGARLPASALTRTLIRLADAPLAGPSANASTRPSPTTAQHVVDDLAGRIEVVLDGGACGVGVESTVVDGLCDPPVVLRPGGISLAELRALPGWERVERAYHDAAHGGNASATAQAKDANGAAHEFKPRAPGMKYKHYSPKARVVLYEGTGRAGWQPISQDELVQSILALQRETSSSTTSTPAANGVSGGEVAPRIGVIRTSTWPSLQGSSAWVPASVKATADGARLPSPYQSTPPAENDGTVTYHLEAYSTPEDADKGRPTVLELDLGRDLQSIAHGLFSALRDLDANGADAILVEGIDDEGDDMASAVMNRLRKAASEVR